MIQVAALVVIAVFGTALFVRYHESTAERIYFTVERWRKLLGLIVLVAIAWTFLRSGRPELILISLVSIALATMYFMIERPNETLS